MINKLKDIINNNQFHLITYAHVSIPSMFIRLFSSVECKFRFEFLSEGYLVNVNLQQIYISYNDIIEYCNAKNNNNELFLLQISKSNLELESMEAISFLYESLGANCISVLQSDHSSWSDTLTYKDMMALINTLKSFDNL